ncbi:hypothetical protein D9615_001820 [Tricholomella constricta]|uniref:Uncharacterized protein n=1 Tax=Tricholomella constricta TaxID=117010 RepID=A0A8H5MAR4_9AGAR|nr:hypothetical protein D9615_001820 [Tricholomella constricta]
MWMWRKPETAIPSLDLDDYRRYREGRQQALPLATSSPRRSVAGSSALPLIGGSRNRPLTRSRERIRPTEDGGVEVYNYDKGPEYEARLAREAEIVEAWRKFKPRSVPSQSEKEVQLVGEGVAVRMASGWYGRW